MRGDPLDGFRDLTPTTEQDVIQVAKENPAAEALDNQTDKVVDAINDLGQQAKTRRALGVVVVMALTAIAGGVLGLLAFAVFRGDEAILEQISSTVQPGTIIVAAISAIAGIAAGVGLKGE